MPDKMEGGRECTRRMSNRKHGVITDTVRYYTIGLTVSDNDVSTVDGNVDFTAGQISQHKVVAL